VGPQPWNVFHVYEFDAEEFAEVLGEKFVDTRIYGQNPVRHWRVSLIGMMARYLPGHTAVRINQILKLPRFLIERAEWRAVRPCRADRDYEINVIVCHRPPHD
jgi:hypothetical protein